MLGRLFRKATRLDWKAEIERSPLRELKELLFFSKYGAGKEGGLDEHMIKELQIRNYKSVRAADLNCKRVNVFIGPPYTGKSNVLGAIALLNIFGDRSNEIPGYNEEELFQMLRVSCWAKIFWRTPDEDPYSKPKYPVVIRAVQMGGEEVTVRVDNEMEVRPGIEEGVEEDEFHPVECSGSRVAYAVHLSLAYELVSSTDLTRFMLYRFHPRHRDDRPFFPDRDFLVPPFGDNLEFLLDRDRELKQLIEVYGENVYNGLEVEQSLRGYLYEKDTAAFFKSRAIKEITFRSLSEPLQRFIFYLTAVHHNRWMVVAIDDLDPVYPSFSDGIADAIATNRFNQYFISTHDPYFLLRILTRVPSDELNVFGIKLEGGETEVRTLTEELEETILAKDSDAFFGLVSRLQGAPHEVSDLHRSTG
jgi:hypothetical protein